MTLESAAYVPTKSLNFFKDLILGADANVSLHTYSELSELISRIQIRTPRAKLMLLPENLLLSAPERLNIWPLTWE